VNGGETGVADLWSRLVERCREVADGREALRLANLAIAAQAGARRGLLGRGRTLDRFGLLDAIEAVAVEPLIALDAADRLVWQPLAVEAAEFAGCLQELEHMDRWIGLVQSADPARKSRGAYATPQGLARPMARLLIGNDPPPPRILDPAAGAGGLLIAVLRELIGSATGKREIRRHVARLHGVELDPVARELGCLAIWLAADEPHITPSLVSERVVGGNAITRDWWSDELYDALIMNPPWDSLRERAADGRGSEGEDREVTLRRLLFEEVGDPELPLLYSAQGRGDRNLYKAFTELAPHLVRRGGRITALLPGAWSSDLGTAALRRLYLSHLKIERWTSFENRRGYFPIDGRYKFGILRGERNPEGTKAFQVRAFAADANEVHKRHTRLYRADLRLVGGVAESIPDVTSARERRLMVQYRRRGAEFFSPCGPFGSVTYRREVDLTEDRKRRGFYRLDELEAAAQGDGQWRSAGGGPLVPLVEGRMVSQYDFFAKSWVQGSGRTAKWSWSNGHRLRECRPQYLIEPKSDVEARIAICDVTSATNTRTMLATWVPPTWRCGNTAPVLVFASEREALAALVVLNSMVFDWFARRVVAGLHLNRFYLDAMAWPSIDSAEMDTLARAGALLTSFSPRYRDLRGARVSVSSLDVGYVDAHTFVELTVAKGYGLSDSDLKDVFSPSLTDRRGLWRHFASDLHATAIAQATRQRLSSATRRRSAAGTRWPLANIT
jgi:hypothetical protein